MQHKICVWQFPQPIATVYYTVTIVYYLQLVPGSKYCTLYSLLFYSHHIIKYEYGSETSRGGGRGTYPIKLTQSTKSLKVLTLFLLLELNFTFFFIYLHFKTDNVIISQNWNKIYNVNVITKKKNFFQALCIFGLLILFKTVVFINFLWVPLIMSHICNESVAYHRKVMKNSIRIDFFILLVKVPEMSSKMNGFHILRSLGIYFLYYNLWDRHSLSVLALLQDFPNSKRTACWRFSFEIELLYTNKLFKC